ncbi:hypothetical protein ACWCL1_07305 [Ligilactobacillus sp. LYQ135]
MKKSNLILVSSLATLLGIGLVSNVNADSVWHAKTPSEIGNLNSDGTYTVREGDRFGQLVCILMLSQLLLNQSMILMILILCRLEQF